MGRFLVTLRCLQERSCHREDDTEMEVLHRWVPANCTPESRPTIETLAACGRRVRRPTIGESIGIELAAAPHAERIERGGNPKPIVADTSRWALVG